MSVDEYSEIWVFAEQRSGELHEVSLELLGKAKAMAAQIKSIFQRRQEPMGGTSGLRIVQGVYEGAVDLYDPGTKTYHLAVDIRLIYKIA